MDLPISERRQIENEMIFKRVNDKVGDNSSSLDAIHLDGQIPSSKCLTKVTDKRAHCLIFSIIISSGFLLPNKTLISPVFSSTTI